MFRFCLELNKPKVARVSYMLYLVMPLIFAAPLSANNFPRGVCGVAFFDFFKEQLPQRSKGIYQICGLNDDIKYIGSALDINKRLAVHVKNSILVPGNMVRALIFHHTTRQREILEYEKFLIGKFSPILNKSSGAPGRPWRSEQLSKLQIFSVQNADLLTDQSKILIDDLLNGKCLYDNRKMIQSLLRIMKLFR